MQVHYFTAIFIFMFTIEGKVSIFCTQNIPNQTKLTLQVEGGGTKMAISALFVGPIEPKNLTFSINLLGSLPYPLGGSKQPKKEFL